MYAFLQKAQIELINRVKRPKNLVNFFVYKEFLSPEECAAVLAHTSKTAPKKGAIYRDVMTPNENMATLDYDMRQASDYKILCGHETEWLYRKIERATRKINKKYWGFQVIGLGGDLRVIRYVSGDHFKVWHKDLLNDHGSTRKLVVIVQLSQPDSYTGGDLELFDGRAKSCPRDQGTLIVFPGFMYHRVTEVTSGARHSLLALMHGPAFK